MTQPATPPIRTEAVKLTDVGQNRPRNQDFVVIEIPDAKALQAKGALYLVADGMGGYQAGEVASQRVAEAIIHEYYADPQTDIAASLSRAAQKANSTVYLMAQADQDLMGMGTTVVAVVVRGTEVHIANVGDSRAYLLRGGEIRQITKDHSFVQEQVDANVITAEAARTHPQRNVITRALGHKPQVQVDTFTGQLTPGDTLLLCSDGLSGQVRDEEMADIVQGQPLTQAVARLTNMANERGGPDNISTVLVRALPPNPARPPAVQLQVSLQPPSPALVEAATAPTGPLGGHPLAPAAAPPARRRGGLVVWVILAGVLLAAAALAVILLVLNSKKDDDSPTMTLAPTTAPIATPVPPTLTLTPMPPSSTPVTATEQATVLPTDAATGTTLPATSTALPTDTPTPTSTPCHSLLPALMAPQQGASLDRGDVTFQWEGGNLCSGYVWQVILDGQPGPCPATTGNQVTCQLPPGEHQWQIELRLRDAQAGTGEKTLSWTINVIAPTQPAQPPPTQPAQPPATQPPEPTKEG